MSDFVNRFSEVRFVDSDRTVKGTGEGLILMPGTPEDLPETWRGVDGWLIAEELLKKM